MHTRMIWTLGIAAALGTAACGDAKSSMIPTSPSALSADTVSAGSADGTSGSMHHRPGHGGGPGNGNGNGNQPPTNTSPPPTSPVAPGKSKVEIEGRIQAVSSNSILVNGQVIMVTSETVIRHGNRMFDLSDLNVDDRVHVRASRVTTPAAPGAAVATLEATLILLQNPGDGDGTETDGLVSVTASDPTATEAPVSTGTFTLTRTGTATQLALPLTVTFTLTGTAANGTDYNSPLTATFLANQATTTVVITPIADGAVENPESVILTLTGVAPYEPGSPITATVQISDAPLPLVSVAASDGAATEAGDSGEFVLTRTGDLSAPLAVTVAISGNATNGVDYESLATTVSFAAGSATASVIVTPIADVVADPSEAVILTVIDGAAYDLGAVASATITISGT